MDDEDKQIIYVKST